MADESTIWMVTHGSYSDYTVDGVFSTKDKADEFVRRYNLINAWGEAEVEEMSLDPEYLVPKLEYIVTISGQDFDNPTYTLNPNPTYRIPYGSARYIIRIYTGLNTWYGEGAGGTPEEAFKSAYDAVAKAKAEALERRN